MKDTLLLIAVSVQAIAMMMQVFTISALRDQNERLRAMHTCTTDTECQTACEDLQASDDCSDLLGPAQGRVIYISVQS